MSWIKTITYSNASAILKRVYDRVKGPGNYIDNVFLVHSLRPRTLKGHMSLYKNTIHNPNNSLPKWYLEAVGVYVSHLNGCDYCVAHHSEGFKRLYPDSEQALQFLKAVQEDRIADVFDGQYLLGMDYARRLTVELQSITQTYIESLKASGFSDGEILELNQVIGYFNYGNRTALGLGVSLNGDVLGVVPEV
ncbi:MAG: peroxidase-related enzyme [Bacteroidota bacterium]